MSSNLATATIFLGFLVIFGLADKILRYMPTDYTLWSDNVVLNYTFAMDKVVPYVNITIKVLQDVKNIEIHSEGQIIGKKETSHYFNFNSTFNLCSLLAWKSATPLGMLAYQYLKEYGNLPDSCPILKGEYRLHRVWFPEDPISSTLPEVDFNLNLQVFATTSDESAVNKMVMNDFWKGEALVKDVGPIKTSIFSMLPKLSMKG